MLYADSQGIRIHYQVEGVGPPLVLQHGFTDSLQSWYDFGYVEALKPDYQLILVDARGHGASDKPHETEAYKPEYNVADIVSVLGGLGITRASFFGYSMGATIAFAMAAHASDRVSALIIGGGNPDPPPPSPHDSDPMLTALKQGAEAIPAIWGVPLPVPVKSRLMANDAQALIANRIALLARASFVPLLPRMRMPCLVYAGEVDGAYPAAKEAVGNMPSATFFSLPGLGHAEAFFRSDLVLPHIIRFLAECERVGEAEERK
jgi:pimeloyl-ACP methyl ester carboxylesterase